MALAAELRRHGVPFLAITNSDDEVRRRRNYAPKFDCLSQHSRVVWTDVDVVGASAQARELYQCGCTYVVQQEALAAVVVGNMVSGCLECIDLYQTAVRESDTLL